MAGRHGTRQPTILLIGIAVLTAGCLLFAGVLLFRLVPGAAEREAGTTPHTTSAASDADRKRPVTPRPATAVIPVLLQNPELPTGCEATAAAMLLQAYGLPITKLQLAASLPVSDIELRDGRRFAAHPNEAFIGPSPAADAAYGVYSAPVAATMQVLIDRHGGGFTATDISGSPPGDILACVAAGAPVAVWVTIDLMPTLEMEGWYLLRGDVYTDEYYPWPGREHCMLLTGYTADQVTVHDPLYGRRTYDRARFFERYEEQGRHAIIVQ